MFLLGTLVGEPFALPHPIVLLLDMPDVLIPALSSHPPLIGFSGSMTLIGFTWGLWPGALIASISTLVGAAIAFFSVRVSITYHSVCSMS